MSIFHDRDGPVRNYNNDEKLKILNVVKSCVNCFQRSSSMVEGRNGQLSLKYQNLHRLSDEKLSALTAIHNFNTRRPDGKTPAECFFEAKHSIMTYLSMF